MAQFSPVVAVTEDNTVRLWNAKTGKHQKTLKGHTDIVSCIAFNTDGKLLASGSADGTVWLWDVNTGRHYSTLTGHTDYIKYVAFNPGNNTVASASHDGTIRLWDTTTITGYTKSVLSNCDTS